MRAGDGAHKRHWAPSGEIAFAETFTVEKPMIRRVSPFDIRDHARLDARANGTARC